MSWPFLRWDTAKKLLVIDKKKAITMPKMLEHLTELVEEFRDPALVVRFQGLATSSPQTAVPWKLQLNLRYNRPYDLLVAMTHSSVWMVAGTSLKIHTPQQSGLAKTVQSLLPKGRGRGKGSGKSKGKNKVPGGPATTLPAPLHAPTRQRLHLVFCQRHGLLPDVDLAMPARQ
jgi:hypothetical protein